jgi:hypothetical protein
MKSLLLSIASLTLTMAWTWEASFQEGKCTKSQPLDRFSTGIPNVIFYQVTRTNNDIMDYGQCIYYYWGEATDNVQNYTWFAKFQDGMYYENEFIMTWYTDPAEWGSGDMADITINYPLPFEVLETDYETYLVVFYCIQSEDDSEKWTFFEIYSTDPFFDDAHLYHYAYERGFTQNQISKPIQDQDYCGDQTIRIN